ncbi:hypothetical protein [Nonomuraea jiangxiensis]|uniref:CorA-like Mg2+ transporter protein n=1 Tax=Nonomuraea jiangxiensis TaxID=633440 RepID=A0A1G8T0X7_9ACTN|nr:hypothetical protein [Nonomuraea jiangxiensis]SDJ35158.1 hypothetical protein SAMN05421869_11035 [Nonomuraea jiangxiensis]
MIVSRYRTTVFGEPGEIPQAPKVSELFVSGVSLITYTALHLRPSVLTTALDSGKIDQNQGENSYLAKLIDHHGLHYSELLPASRLPAEIAFAAHAQTDDLHQSIVWMDDEYALLVIPWVFATANRTDALGSIRLSHPLDLDELVQLVNVITSRSVCEKVAKQAVTALCDQAILSDGDVIERRPMNALPAVQIWDLNGSAREEAPYDGVAESRRFCWEISTLMAYATDHVSKDGLWRRRSPDQVFNDVATGYTVLGDHMVFVNPSCCLEISHLPIDLRPRSEFRMRYYGFDSSSIFVWTVANLRQAVSENLERHYRLTMETLITEPTIAAKRNIGIAKSQLRHSAMLTELHNFRHSLHEARNRAFDEELCILRKSDEAAARTAKEMDRVIQLASELSRARDQVVTSNSNTLLAALAAGLAIGGIPELVEQVDVWIGARDWLKLCVAVALAIIIIAAILRIWKGRR